MKAVTVLNRLWPYLRAHRAKFAAGVFLILLSTVVETLIPLVVGRSVDIAIDPSRDFRTLAIFCGVFLCLIVFKSGLEALQAFVIQSTGQEVTHELRSVLFRKIESLPVSYFDRNPTGRLLTRVVNDIKSLGDLFTAAISVLALDVMIIVGTVVGMFVVHAKLAAVVLLSFPLVLITIHLFGKRLAEAYRAVRRKLSEINGFLGENIGAIATIQRLGAEEARMKKFATIVEEHEKAQLESLRVFAIVQPITNVLNGVATSTLLVFGGYWVIEEQMRLGVLVAFLGYLRNIFQPVRDMVEKYNTFLSATVSAERVIAILDEESEIMTGGRNGETSEAQTLRHDIRFERVTFSYPTRQATAIEEVSFELQDGQSLAVVGATGSGKSTIIRLLLRFYEPDSGTISLSGTPLPDWNKGELRRRIGVIHQDIYLFQGTLRDNLTLGREGLSDDYLRSTCERAQVSPFAHARGGLDMAILEGGTNLSLGERQLISFARVLAFDPPILVLDEATSSVDRLLERRLMEALREVLERRTSIIIAHRISTIRRCHRVIVMERGKIVEEGTYESLLRHQGVLARFHEIHSRGLI